MSWHPVLSLQTQSSSLGSGWELERFWSLPAQHHELCSVVGVVRKHWLLQRSFRRREFDSETLEGAWALELSAALGIYRGLCVRAVQVGTDVEQPSVRSLSTSVCLWGCGCGHRGLRNESVWALGAAKVPAWPTKGSGVHVPGRDPAVLLSSVPQPRNTSTVSWSDRSSTSICSSMSTFTSMEEMLPKGAAETEAREKVSDSARQRAPTALCRQDPGEGTEFYLLVRAPRKSTFP